MKLHDNEEAVTAWLHAHGIREAPAELDQMVQHAVARLGPSLQYEDPTRELTEKEAGVLIRGGFELKAPAWQAHPLAVSVADFVALLQTAWTTDQVAQRLGVDPSRIRQRLSSRPPTLYGVKVGLEWRVPIFQFEDNRLVPGFDEVLSRLDPELHPLAVYRWFNIPNTDLVHEGNRHIPDTPLSPKQWLLLGLPVEAVLHLASDL